MKHRLDYITAVVLGLNLLLQLHLFATRVW